MKLRPLRLLGSARGTVALLCVLAALLLLNVALPQTSVVGAERLAEIAEGRPLLRFLLIDLGMANTPTSPVFLAVLGLFFLNLAQVLAKRVGPTWRRCAIRPRSETSLAAWIAHEQAKVGPLSSGFDPGFLIETLRGYGYQVRRGGPTTFWGIKHRLAPLGFLLFHLSFFLLFGGGVLIYYTRFVGFAILSEGQEFVGEYMAIERQPAIGGPPDLRFTVVSVDPRFEGGEPVHLGAVFRFRAAGTSRERRARVNHPAVWGHATVLVSQAGLAPVLWLTDSRGYSLDRVVVPMRTRGGDPTDATLAGARLAIRLYPLGASDEFPHRSELATTPIRLEVKRGDELLFDGSLTPGGVADLGGRRLQLEGLRYWVGVRVVAEHGGALLIAGFVLATFGLIWRLLLFRCEVAVSWSDQGFRLVGRGEYFSGRFEQELATIRDTLATGPVGEVAAGSSPTKED